MHHQLAHILGTLLMVVFFFFFAAICTIFQQTTTCTMIPSLIMHLYDYQSSVNNITMCWLFGDFLTRWAWVSRGAIVQWSRVQVSDAKQCRPCI